MVPVKPPDTWVTRRPWGRAGLMQEALVARRGSSAARVETVDGASSRLRTRSSDPFCAGPDGAELVGSFQTPVDLHFVHNHGTVPVVDPRAYRLHVDGLVSLPLEVSLEQLVGTFAKGYMNDAWHRIAVKVRKKSSATGP
jgi:DMSO/TMAO reductase YedYZ molybdopterin-dependent catalytic subunit